MGVLAYFSLSSNVTTPAGLHVWDKFSHFTAYAVLAVLLIRTVAVWQNLSDRLLIVSGVACAVYGLLLEGLQGMMGSGRQLEVGDLLANALGVMVVCVIFRRFILP